LEALTSGATEVRAVWIGGAEHGPGGDIARRGDRRQENPPGNSEIRSGIAE
jgi:hypothetical protein